MRADWLHFRGLELRGVQQIITTVNESWGVPNLPDNAAELFSQPDVDGGLIGGASLVAQDFLAIAAAAAR